MAPTIVVIGMRGEGKTTIVADAANYLGFTFTDLNQSIAAANGGKPLLQLVEEQGWEGFRSLELEALEIALGVGGVRPGIVLCGGGIIDSAAALERLEHHWPVVMFDRHVDDIAAYLDKTPKQAALKEPAQDTYARRLPRYLRCADFRFPVARGQQSVDVLGLQLAGFVSQVLGLRSLYLGPDTFFVSLTFPDYVKADASVMRSAAEGADVLEFRVDLLASWEHVNIAQQLAALRRETCGAPVLYTVRTKEHGGAFDRSEDEYFQLVHLGHKLGAEMLDVECTWSPENVKRVVSLPGRGPLIGSFHDFHRMPPREELRRLFTQCCLGGAAAVAKVVVKPESLADNTLVQEVGTEVSAEMGCAFIGLCLGELGKLSRVLNKVMTPATHQSLMAAAPGQMSAKELLSCRKQMAMLTAPRQYITVGDPGISFFNAVTELHSAAMGEKPTEGGACVAGVAFGDRPEQVRRLLALSSVGGVAVIGAGLQQALAADMAFLSTEAKVAGAVDTVVIRDGAPIGENCFASALHSLIKGEGPTTAAAPSSSVAVGTAAKASVAMGALKAAGFQQPRGLDGVSDVLAADALLPAVKPSCWGGCLQMLGLQAASKRPRLKLSTGEVSSGLFTEAGLKAAASSLAALEKLDVLMLLPGAGVEQEDGCAALIDSQAWQDFLQALKRLAPVVVDAGTLPIAGGPRVALLGAARDCGCKTIEAPELLYEVTCKRLRCWMKGVTGPRGSIAARLLQELPVGSMTTAGRAVLEQEAAFYRGTTPVPLVPWV